MSIFLRWGIPAFVTVVGGTAAAVATGGAGIPGDLSARTEATLVGLDSGWARVSFDMRDATVRGTAPTQEMVDDIIAQVAAVHGVRSVTSNVVLAEHASPFPFVVSVEKGALKLSGGLPDEESRSVVRALAGEGATDRLRPMSGAPGRAAWEAAAGHAIAFATQLDEGEAALADLTLTVSGRAKSPEAYETLMALAAEPAPEGVALAYREIRPPLHSPFEWHAEYDGKLLTLSGAAPSEAFVADLEALAPSGTTVAMSLVLASGAPAEFETTARLLVENLLKLEHGSADISGNSSTLSGAPADIATAESVRVAMTPGGTTVTLGAPHVADYWFSAERSGGEIVLDGFVPEETLRDRLEAIAGVDATSLELGRGAPDRFEPGVDFIIELLGRMSEGRASLAGTSIAVEGRAATLADLTALETAFDLGAPQGLILAATSIKPPLATPFTFGVEKSAGGDFAISGYVPSEAARKAIVAALPGAVDTSVIADGNPAGFEAAAVKALDVLDLLDSGKVSYDGASWSLTGAVDSAQKAFAAETAFAATGLRAAGWTYDVELPTAAETAALPVIDPYAWRAEKPPGGSVTFSGFVPTEQLKRYLAGHAGQGAVDGMSLAGGAPEGFIPAAIGGLDALLAMDEGTLTLTDGNWSLTGKVGSTATQDTLEAALKAATDTSGWHVAIQTSDAASTLAEPTQAAALPDEPAKVETTEPPAADTVPPASEATAAPATPAGISAEPAETQVAAVEPTPSVETTTPVVRNHIFDARKLLGGPVTFAGAVPAEPMRRHLAIITGGEPAEQLRIDSTGLPGDFIANADAGSRALTQLADGEFGLDGDGWVFTGRAESEATREAALAQLAAVPDSAKWQTEITLLPPLLVCRDKVDAFAARNAILFQSGSARIADESVPAIDELVSYLSLCPAVMVNVEGHTDADGDDDANLALSVARAESVVDALILRGIGPERLYAIGYGEGLPIASNETRAGKQANRRIAFTLSEE